MTPLSWGPPPWVVVTGIALLGALLAYRWTYTTYVGLRARRKNQQWLLIVSLLAVALVAGARAWAVA